MIAAFLILVLLCIVAMFTLRWAYPLPKAHGPRIKNEPPAPAEIGRLYGKVARKFPKRSGLYPIAHGQEALLCRLELAKLAVNTIHAQYYIWNDDLTGKLLLGALVDAADRGVKVRLILDDNTTGDTELMWASALQHPNITVKLFNPFRARHPRWLNYFYLLDFMRLNRRMHNKSLIVDGEACIVGGRNVGDNYFAAHTGPHFTDMDVLAVGEVVRHVEKSFESYWSCGSVYDAKTLLKNIKHADIDILRNAVKQRRESPEGAALFADFAKYKSSRQIARGRLPLEWAPARLLADDPRKGLGRIDDIDLVVGKLRLILGRGKRELKIASAYFVPGKPGARFLQALAKRGLAIQVLTNSLSSNNLISVHSGYARYRKKLLRAKLELYELKANRRVIEEQKKPARTPRKFFGASSSTLHAKVFILDKTKVFISSFNFDPRSTWLNCEMGILMESPALARFQLKQVEQRLRRHSYRLELLDGHRLIWLDLQSRPIGVISREPDTELSRRFLVWCISKLPMEWLL